MGVLGLHVFLSDERKGKGTVDSISESNWKKKKNSHSHTEEDLPEICRSCQRNIKSFFVLSKCFK